MSRPSKTNAAFMSGVPELLVLKLLDRKEMYGYELVRAIRLTSGETIALAEGVVYPTLHSLERRGLLKSREASADGRKRFYYQTTGKGRRRLQELQNEWQRVNSGIASVLDITSQVNYLGAI